MKRPTTDVRLPSVEAVAALLANPDTVAVEEIPAAIGELERVKAQLWARLVVSPPRASAPQHVKAKEIVRLFDLRLGRVYELARTGRIPCIRTGKRAMRFDPEAVRKALASLSQ